MYKTVDYLQSYPDVNPSPPSWKLQLNFRNRADDVSQELMKMRVARSSESNNKDIRSTKKHEG